MAGLTDKEGKTGSTVCKFTGEETSTVVFTAVCPQLVVLPQFTIFINGLHSIEVY